MSIFNESELANIAYALNKIIIFYGVTYRLTTVCDNPQNWICPQKSLVSMWLISVNGWNGKIPKSSRRHCIDAIFYKIQQRKSTINCIMQDKMRMRECGRKRLFCVFNSQSSLKVTIYSLILAYSLLLLVHVYCVLDQKRTKKKAEKELNWQQRFNAKIMA